MAIESDYKQLNAHALVCIDLEGGYDEANVIIYTYVGLVFALQLCTAFSVIVPVSQNYQSSREDQLTSSYIQVHAFKYRK